MSKVMTENEFLDRLYIESIGQESNWYLDKEGMIVFDGVESEKLEENVYIGEEGYHCPLTFLGFKDWTTSGTPLAIELQRKIIHSADNDKKDENFDSTLRTKLLLAVGLLP